MSKSFKIIASALLLAIGALTAGLVVLYKIDPKNRTRQRTAIRTTIKATDKPSAPPTSVQPVQAKSRYQVSGSLPEEFGPATQVERAQITWYCITNSMDDVGDKRQTDEVKINPDGTFAAGYSPQEKFRGTVRVELLVTSKTFVPLMGRAESRLNLPAQILFVPPLAATNATHVTGVCVDASDDSPVPRVGIYLNANKALTARADDQGRFECYLPSNHGRAGFVPWLRAYVGQYVAVRAGPGESREVKVRMRKNLDPNRVATPPRAPTESVVR